MPADRNTKIVTGLFGIENSNRIEVATKHKVYSRLPAAFCATR